jgi:hypothetical protein
MKKLLLLILTVAIALGCFASCSYLDFGSLGSNQSTDITANYFDSPEDEEKAAYTVTQTDENGLTLEVTIHGYKSESLGKEFYVKNNEYFLADVKLTNGSDTPVYQFLPTACRDSSPAHNHEISFDIANGDHKLNSSSNGFTCPEMTEVWTIEPGASYEWQLKLAAGKLESTNIAQFPGFGTITESNKETEEVHDKAPQESAQIHSILSQSSIYYYNTAFSQDGNISYETYTLIGDHTFIVNGSSFSYTFITNGSVSYTGALPLDGDDSYVIRLYDSSVFPDNVCVFAGDLSFGYMKSSDGTVNDLSVSVPLSIEVVFVSPAIFLDSAK